MTENVTDKITSYILTCIPEKNKLQNDIKFRVAFLDDNYSDRQSHISIN